MPNWSKGRRLTRWAWRDDLEPVYDGALQRLWEKAKSLKVVRGVVAAGFGLGTI